MSIAKNRGLRRGVAGCQTQDVQRLPDEAETMRVRLPDT